MSHHLFCHTVILDTTSICSPNNFEVVNDFMTGLRKRVVVVIQREENINDECEVVTIGKWFYNRETAVYNRDNDETSYNRKSSFFAIRKTSKTSFNRFIYNRNNVIYNRRSVFISFISFIRDNRYCGSTFVEQ